MNRRNALKKIAGLSLGTVGLLSGSGLFQLKKAYAAVGKSLIIIFQRGGCDGINTCIPYGDEHYYSLRPSIAIPPPDNNNDNAALDLNGYLGLHPCLSDLHALYHSGALAIMPAVHYPSASFSHFDSQHYIESAATSKELDGWLNRHLQTFNQNNVMRAIGIGNGVPQSLRGNIPVSSFFDIESFNLNLAASEETKILADLVSIYGQTPHSGAYRELLHTYGNTLINDIAIIQQLDPNNYQPEHGAIYPQTRLGKQLKETAYLLKANPSTEVITISTGGWDTHSNQGGGETTGHHSRRLKDFSLSINALYTDLTDQMENVVILTCTEFGRTAKENASRGTDHGSASTWFALGGGIKGGIYGAYPGLSPEQLHRGRYLDFSIDYRNIFGDILSQHLGNNALASVLPNHNYSPIGLFSSTS